MWKSTTDHRISKIPCKSMKHRNVSRKDDCVLQNSLVLIQFIVIFVIECRFKKSYQISSSWISSSNSICENISFTTFAHHFCYIWPVLAWKMVQLVSRSSLIIDRFCLHWSCSPRLVTPQREQLQCRQNGLNLHGLKIWQGGGYNFISLAHTYTMRS